MHVLCTLFKFCEIGVFSKKEVAEANFVMHEVHCQRNIVLCSKCDEPVPKVQLEEHIEENHALVNCDLCSRIVERSCLNRHKVWSMYFIICLTDL